jgi:nucleosome binding factor SPN SPT16 subunit
MLDYSAVCIDGTSIQILSGITLAMSTVNIMIFLFDLYVKYENMMANKNMSEAFHYNVKTNAKQYHDGDNDDSSSDESEYEVDEDEDDNEHHSEFEGENEDEEYDNDNENENKNEESNTHDEHQDQPEETPKAESETNKSEFVMV